MRELKKEELKEINGGGLSWGAVSLIAAGVTFIIGVIDGYVRPMACRK